MRRILGDITKFPEDIKHNIDEEVIPELEYENGQYVLYYKIRKIGAKKC